MKRAALSLLIFLFTTVGLFARTVESQKLLFVYSLHGQTRKYEMTFQFKGDTLNILWGIERNTKWQSGKYIVTPQGVNSGNRFSYLQPVDGKCATLAADETFAFISKEKYADLNSKKEFIYNNTLYKQTTTQEIIECNLPLLHVTDSDEGSEMWIVDDPALPLIWKMKNNPVEIDWQVKSDAENLFGILEQLALTPEKSASTYYAYPSAAWQHTTPPKGYTPFYISHYGRHGSRWITDEKRYTKVIDAFNAHTLTPLGKEVKSRLDIIYKDAKGNAGMLSPIGERQHREIAQRMYARFPELFTGNKNISATSTVVPRCIKSMQCFTDQLLEANSNLNIKKDSSLRNMDYMAFDTEQMKEWNSDKAPWREDFRKFENENIHSDRLIASLTRDKIDKTSADELMMALYWIASDMQDTTTGISLYDIFTTDELTGIWKSVNYRMYLCNGPAPINKGIPAKSATSLLRDIIDKAYNAITSGKESATLRFGHDTNLLRLLTLISIKGLSTAVNNPKEYYLAWQDYNITPMAANLQIIFYRNNNKDILVKFMLNERELFLNINNSSAPYYSWDIVKEYLSKKMQ